MDNLLQKYKNNIDERIAET